MKKEKRIQCATKDKYEIYYFDLNYHRKEKSHYTYLRYVAISIMYLIKKENTALSSVQEQNQYIICFDKSNHAIDFLVIYITTNYLELFLCNLFFRKSPYNDKTNTFYSNNKELSWNIKPRYISLFVLQELHIVICHQTMQL